MIALGMPTRKGVSEIYNTSRTCAYVPQRIRPIGELCNPVVQQALHMCLQAAHQTV